MKMPDTPFLSLLRERTKGPDPKAEAFTGYRDGRNRRGEGLDVAARLRGEHHAQGVGAYDALVVTERHDLPYAAYHESTALYLAHIVEQLVAGNAAARPFLYHTWLEVDMDEPATWLRYERAALRLAASQVLAQLGRQPLLAGHRLALLIHS